MKMRIVTGCVVALLVTLAAVPAAAWNALGHKTIAEIAWRQLKPEQRLEIVDVLRRHPRFDADFAGQMTDDVLAADKSTQDQWIFQHAATWPDIARGLPAGERGKYDRPTWHYINLPLFLDDSDRQHLARTISVNTSTEYPGNLDKQSYNVLQAIQHCQVALKSRAGADVQALGYCWLFHLVGDIHQPLHSTALFSAAQFPNGDRGGNEIPLKRGRNLHSLWDNLLGRQHYMRNVDKELIELQSEYHDLWKSAAEEMDPNKWAEESHSLCETVVYSDAVIAAVRNVPAGGKLSQIELPESYYQKAGDVARRRIIAAGVRLGRLLGGDAPDVTEEDADKSILSTQHTPALPLTASVRETITEPSTLTYWLNSSTGVRHNTTCRYYGKTKAGRKCTESDGEPCGICGG